MKISVITVTLNDISGLKKTVGSVLSQTCDDFEYIVIDGASTDGSVDYIRGVSGINRWISEPDKGIYNAMNKGVALARGEYCIFMNAGDIFYDETSLERMIPYLHDADFYIGDTIMVQDGKRRYWPAPDLPLNLTFMFVSAPSHQATFTRTSHLKASPYREDYRIVSDWEKFFMGWYTGRCTYVPVHQLIAEFYVNGYSWIHKDWIPEEKNNVFRQVGIPERVISYFNHKHGLEKKVEYAMAKSPLQRDWKLIRNGFKYLWKDIIHNLKR